MRCLSVWLCPVDIPERLFHHPTVVDDDDDDDGDDMVHIGVGIVVLVVVSLRCCVCVHTGCLIHTLS